MLSADNLEENMSFGENLKRLRRDNGWTQHQLSVKSGLKPSHIPKLEKDQSDPKLSTIYKLIDALECTTDDLLMDYGKIETDPLLVATLHRAGKLKELDKKIIIHVVDRYCIAAGMEESFSEENRQFPFIRFRTEAPDRVMPDKELEGVK